MPLILILILLGCDANYYYFFAIKAPAGTDTVGAEPTLFVFKNLHVIGTLVGSMRDTDGALSFAERVSWPHEVFFIDHDCKLMPGRDC